MVHTHVLGAKNGRNGPATEAGEGMETTANVASAYRPRRGDKQYGRSRITNGGELLPGVDQRSRWVRRCRDVIAAHLSDLGGEDNTSAAERSIIRRAAVLTTELEQLEVRFATAGEASADDLDLYSRASANLRRLLEAVGLQRRARSIGATRLGDILESGELA
jgi:hypothetical protein